MNHSLKRFKELLLIYVDNIKKAPTEYFEVGFFPLNKIFPVDDYFSISNSNEDKYIENTNFKDKKWNEFKQDILDNGMYWFFFISPIVYKYVEHKQYLPKEIYTEIDSFGDPCKKMIRLNLREGNHRLRAYRELAEEEKIKKDFLVPVVISRVGWSCDDRYKFKDTHIDNKLLNPFECRFYGEHNLKPEPKKICLRSLNNRYEYDSEIDCVKETMSDLRSLHYFYWISGEGINEYGLKMKEYGINTETIEEINDPENKYLNIIEDYDLTREEVFDFKNYCEDES